MRGKMFVFRFMLSLAGMSCFGKDADVRPAFAVAEHPRSAAELKRACSVIFAKSSLRSLRELKKAKNTTLALSAAWKEALRCSASSKESKIKALECGFARFVGFVDGRLPVDLPEWWEANVASAKGSPYGNTAFIPSEKSPWVDGETTPLTPKGVATLRVGDGVEVDVGNVGFRIPAKVFESAHIAVGAGMVSPVVEGESIFVVVAPSDTFWPGRLARFDRASGKLLWDSEIWVGGKLSSVAIGGRLENFAEPKIGRDGNVYVFGTAGICAYIEAFSRVDGTPILRFSTVYLEDQ
jgi:hypothetical protein